MITQTGSAASAAKGRPEFRIIPRIETYPKVVSFAQTALGRIALLAVFGLGLHFFVPEWSTVLLQVFLLAVVTFIPELRHFLLALGPIAMVVVELVHAPLLLSLTLGVIASGVLMYWSARRWPKSPFGRRPIVFLLSGFTLLILSACATRLHSWQYTVAWDLVGVVSLYVWFIGYALMDRTSKPKQDLTLQIASFRPLWGSTTTPFPKGAAYLRRIEARDEKQLAIVQLKGLKLLAWAILLAMLSHLWNRFFHGFLHIPTSVEALAMSVHRVPLAWHVRWESQILAFFESIFWISIFGHQIIACCRMAGFNALRNTYRPLSSTTIAEFFNRFYYYFKELLVDFFFYPTFLRYWKGHRRLRMVFATFAAAFFGNSFYHLVRDWQIIRDDGLWRAMANYQVLLFYNFALTAGLCISQLRKRGRPPAGLFRGRLLPAFGVGFFYCLLNVFETSERMYPLSEHLRYLASLFFIH